MGSPRLSPYSQLWLGFLWRAACEKALRGSATTARRVGASGRHGAFRMGDAASGSEAGTRCREDVPTGRPAPRLTRTRHVRHVCTSAGDAVSSVPPSAKHAITEGCNIVSSQASRRPSRTRLRRKQYRILERKAVVASAPWSSLEGSGGPHGRAENAFCTAPTAATLLAAQSAP